MTNDIITRIVPGAREKFTAKFYEVIHSHYGDDYKAILVLDVKNEEGDIVMPIYYINEPQNKEVYDLLFGDLVEFEAEYVLGDFFDKGYKLVKINKMRVI